MVVMVVINVVSRMNAGWELLDNAGQRRAGSRSDRQTLRVYEREWQGSKAREKCVMAQYQYQRFVSGHAFRACPERSRRACRSRCDPTSLASAAAGRQGQRLKPLASRAISGIAE